MSADGSAPHAPPAVLDAMPLRVALLDPSARLVAVNRARRDMRLPAEHTSSQMGRGDDLLRFRSPVDELPAATL